MISVTQDTEQEKQHVLPKTENRRFVFFSSIILPEINICPIILCDSCCSVTYITRRMTCCILGTLRTLRRIKSKDSPRDVSR